MKNHYFLYSDVGHAWLAVPLSEIYALGLQAKISRYSYQNNETVYLEEDCDLGAFIEAKRAIGGEVTWTEVHNAQYESPVKQHNRYEFVPNNT